RSRVRFKGCPGWEAKAPRRCGACFLRTQQRAKSQCIEGLRILESDVLTPVIAGSSGVSRAEIAMMTHGWVFGFRLPSGVAGACHSTESLILAQDERWRRA